jgi:hypothetical protein
MTDQKEKEKSERNYSRFKGGGQLIYRTGRQVLRLRQRKEREENKEDQRETGQSVERLGRSPESG